MAGEVTTGALASDAMRRGAETAKVMSRILLLLFSCLLLWRGAARAESVDIRIDLSSAAPPSQWLAYSGDWIVARGVLRQQDVRAHPARLFFTTPLLADFEFSAAFRIARTRRSVRSADFLFRCVDTANYCYFHCNSQIDMAAFARADDKSYWTQPRRFRRVGITAGEWHEAKVVGRGDVFIFYLDGKEVARASYSGLKAGCLGLGTCSARAEFKNIRIKGTPATNAPAFRLGDCRYAPAARAEGPGLPDWSPALLASPDGALLLAYSTAADGPGARPGDIVLLRSDDRGRNWRRIAAVAAAPADERAPTLRLDGRAIVCAWRIRAGGRRRARSTDGGLTWEPLPGADPAPDRAELRDARGRLVIDADLRVRRLLRGDRSWRTSAEPLWPGEAPRLARCANGDVLLFLSDDKRGLHVLRSFDFGATWQGPVIVCPVGYGPAAAAVLADGSVLVAYGRRKPRTLTVSRLDLRGPQIAPVLVGSALPREAPGRPSARSGAVVAAPAVAGVNPRNTEGSIVRLKDGRLLLAYTRFYGGGGDFALADISGMLSSDAGRTWSAPFLIQRNDAECNVMSASLLRLRSGELLLGYLRKQSRTDCRYMVRLSRDEGRTWTREICATPRPVGYYVVNNDRVIQLRTGRLLVPAADHADWRKHRAWAVCYLSDDDGRTWRRGKGRVELPGVGCQEPGVVELKDGRVLMIIRNSLGSIYKAYSSDGGETWSEAVSMGLASPVAPASIKRIPSTGDLLLIWNHSKTRRRVPLTAAVSSDEGETWTRIRDIETRGRSFAYTSICFVEETAVLSYWSGTAAGLSLVTRRIPVAWFYGE